MEEAKGPVKHVLLAKFKDDVTQEKIDELIKGYANLVNLIEPMKAFQCKEAVAEYVAHPIHVEFANMFLGSLDKVLVIDYKPTSV
ncbi:hypothetical protein F2Q69_00038067 [Brassica cretica]|uniref:Stress-response A/B barrel domain-containing protein n=1 Tax=Brassica cretica TaxID=69181 RepID=A0A8S9SF21_BRACR|nr:hypothetical protein F2Q69_00038067 [Brassica cretica]